jgi:hypothetical protein
LSQTVSPVRPGGGVSARCPPVHRRVQRYLARKPRPSGPGGIAPEPRRRAASPFPCGRPETTAPGGDCGSLQGRHHVNCRPYRAGCKSRGIGSSRGDRRAGEVAADRRAGGSRCAQPCTRAITRRTGCSRLCLRVACRASTSFGSARTPRSGPPAGVPQGRVGPGRIPGYGSGDREHRDDVGRGHPRGPLLQNRVKLTTRRLNRRAPWVARSPMRAASRGPDTRTLRNGGGTDQAPHSTAADGHGTSSTSRRPSAR